MKSIGVGHRISHPCKLGSRGVARWVQPPPPPPPKKGPRERKGKERKWDRETEQKPESPPTGAISILGAKIVIKAGLAEYVGPISLNFTQKS